MDPLGTAATIAHLVNRARKFYDACRSAPGEFRVASRHVKQMTLAIEVVDADLLRNRRSFLHQPTATAKAKLANLDSIVKSCSQHLLTLEQLLKDYHNHPFSWARSGKTKVVDAQGDLMMAVTRLNTFMNALSLGVLDQLLSMMQRLDQAHQRPVHAAEIRRRKKVVAVLIASRFIFGLKLDGKKRRRAAAGRAQPKRKNSSKIVRPSLSWGTKPNIKRRKTLIDEYLKDLEIGGTSSARGAEYYECWRVEKASVALGPGIHGNPKPHRRGQGALKEMATTFQKAGVRKASAGDSSVKYLLRCLHQGKKGPNPWEFVAGRIESRAVSGIQENQWTMIIIKGSRR